MTTRRLTLALAAGLLLAGAGAFAAGGRGALADVAPGLWDVSRSATGAAAERRCLGDIAMLAQGEQPTAGCTRVIVGQTGSSVTYHFTCADGGFGQARISVVTPRAVKVDIQGIASGLPFATTLHARRVGDCHAR